MSDSPDPAGPAPDSRSTRGDRSDPPNADPPNDFPDDPAVAVVLHQLPEFEAAYLELVATFDDAPGGPAVFTELADFVASRLTAIEADRPVLERAVGALEMVADSEDGESAELVGYAFLDSLSPIDRDRIRPWLGPRTRSLLDELDGGSGG
ncbi:MAG TPA: hypothetical protein VHZ02_05520 [Acidimicrobiales bacterium]|nr:hypothetical protein [Acidimicrobiales bacterium]